MKAKRITLAHGNDGRYQEGQGYHWPTTATDYVLLRTELGDELVLYDLEGDSLPRTC